MINFNVPALTGKEQKYIAQALKAGKFSGDGPFTKKCQEWLERKTGAKKVLLTTSGTHALDMAAILSGVKKGDEVIMASYTFSSTANAFALRGAKLVFVDIRPDTMNIDERLIEKAITKRTRVIVVMHNGGIACEMDKIMAIAKKHKLIIIEDAAHAVMAKYKNRPLGTIGDIGCFSFHETKNLNSGEGGAILLNDHRLVERAEVIREKGTNRSRFLRGEVDKYTWVDEGSSYLMSEYGAAVLDSQLQSFAEIQTRRFAVWNAYAEHLADWADAQGVTLMRVPDDRTHTAHLFYLRMPTHGEQVRMLSHLRSLGVVGTFHYVPLDTAPAGLRFGRTLRPLTQSKAFSEEIVRLPLWAGMTDGQVERVLAAVQSFVVEPQSLLTAVENPRDEVRAG